MCGKFTTKADWKEIVDLAFAQPAQDGDEIQTFRVMNNLRLITWDAALGLRRIGIMRWGFPHPSDHRRPQPDPCPGRNHRQRAGFRGGLP